MMGRDTYYGRSETVDEYSIARGMVTRMLAKGIAASTILVCAWALWRTIRGARPRRSAPRASILLCALTVGIGTYPLLLAIVFWTDLRALAVVAIWLALLSWGLWLGRPSGRGPDEGRGDGGISRDPDDDPRPPDAPDPGGVDWHKFEDQFWTHVRDVDRGVERESERESERERVVAT